MTKSEPARPSPAPAPLRVSIAGLGTVGAAVIEVLERDAERLAARCGRPVEIAGITARNRGRKRSFDVSPYQWASDPAALARSDADVFVELIGGDEGPAREAVETALDAGRHVVTANKALLAKHGVQLAERAEANGVALLYEAAVAGGIPIIKTMRESFSGNDVTRVSGILNGTCNYILTRMEDEGISFADCLAHAQRLGYAEADPTFDVRGDDTAHKLAILASLAFGTRLSFEALHLEGIAQLTLDDIEAAHALGYRIKLLGVATRTADGVETRVHPALVPLDTALADVGGVLNAVVVESALLGQVMMVGPGAGGAATASAVLGDITDLARHSGPEGFRPVLGTRATALVPHEQAATQAHAGGFFIRMEVLDRPGVMASIATRMADEAISLESIVQRKRGEAGPHEVQPIVLITHETTERAIRSAVDAMLKEDYLVAAPRVIRIER